MKKITPIIISTIISLIVGMFILEKYQINVSELIRPPESDYSATWYRGAYNPKRDNGLLKYEPGSTVVSKKSESYDVTSQVNNDGWLDAPFQFSQNRCNVLIVGDSYVAAHQVKIEQKFHRLLEIRLENKYPLDFAVHAVGMDGTTVIQQIEFIKDVLKDEKHKIDFFIFALISNDVRDSYAPLDIAAHNTFSVPADIDHPILNRTSVYGGIDGEPFHVIHPSPEDHTYSRKVIDPAPSDWNELYRMAVLALPEHGIMSREHIGNRFISGTAWFLFGGTAWESDPENYLGVGNLEPFWQAVVQSYDYSVGLAQENFDLNSNNSAAFTAHSLHIYGNKESSQKEKRIAQVTKPWLSRGIPVKRIDSNEYKFNLKAMAIPGDGHLNIEGHSRVADFLLAELGDSIYEKCNK